MTGEVWISSVMTDSSIGLKQGAREKYFGENWAPADFIIGPKSNQVHEALNLHERGVKLSREQMTEAMFVFSPNHWRRVGDLFTAGGFFAVKGRLAEVLMHFDLGEGELIEFPIYEADKKTQLPGPFYLLNFGCQKDTFLPEESRRVKPMYTDEQKKRLQELHPGGHQGLHLWRDNGLKDNDVAVTSEALKGPDLWFDPKLRERIFMSGQLHDAILNAKIKIDFRFAKARIVDV